MDAVLASFRRAISSYTLVYFQGLRAYAAWIARCTRSDLAASALCVASVLVAFAALRLLPSWLSLTVGIAALIPYAFLLYMFVRHRLRRRR